MSVTGRPTPMVYYKDTCVSCGGPLRTVILPPGEQPVRLTCLVLHKEKADDISLSSGGNLLSCSNHSVLACGTNPLFKQSCDYTESISEELGAGSLWCQARYGDAKYSSPTVKFKRGMCLTLLFIKLSGLRL